MQPSHEVSTPDGRVLRYCLYGPEDGRPVIAHEGTPGSRFMPPKLVEIVERSGVRILNYDRPGYGGSTRQAGRSVAYAADDVALLADAQGWATFATVGVSGGGPHALATAVRLPDRVTRCAAVVCPAPHVEDGPDGPAGLSTRSWLVGLSPGNVAEFNAARQGEEAYRPLVERVGREALANLERDEPALLSSAYELPESDLAELRRRLAEPDPERLQVARMVWIDGANGWIDDEIAMIRPWGVDLADLRVPVALWYGPDDVLCPRGHTDWLLAHLPGVEPRELPGGHMLSDDGIADVLRWVGGDGSS
jgi:pimeloyl-ACP methyl ester carboxylesterase